MDVADRNKSPIPHRRKNVRVCAPDAIPRSTTSFQARVNNIARGLPPAGTVEGLFALGGLIARARALNVPTPVLCEMRDKMGL